jgi:hypothetical protein
VTVADLVDGRHVFRARAVDDAGNRSLPATWIWTVDA